MADRIAGFSWHRMQAGRWNPRQLQRMVIWRVELEIPPCYLNWCSGTEDGPHGLSRCGDSGRESSSIVVGGYAISTCLLRNYHLPCLLIWPYVVGTAEESGSWGSFLCRQETFWFNLRLIDAVARCRYHLPFGPVCFFGASQTSQRTGRIPVR